MMKLDEVVPWGRTRREYELMFRLRDEDRGRRILACADGPASFQAEWTRAGGDVLSIDPIYAFEADQIRTRFEATVDRVIGQVKASPENWTWSFHHDPDDLLATRRRALDEFLGDFEGGKNSGRYVADALPDLTSIDGEAFDLALCSHFLLLYSEQFSEEFHIASVKRLCSAAPVVRIFPILDLTQKPSPHLDAVRRQAETIGFESEILTVDYELQRGGNRMLQLVRLD
ncbi:MAG: SAM-dependent methyltransferase [Planctomycetota bacterium]